MYEQNETLFKHFNKILSLNTEAISTHYGKQAEFVNAMFTESLNYAKGLPETKSVEALYEGQKAYWESMQQKFSDNARDTYELWNQTSEKISGLLNSGEDVSQAKPAKTARSASSRKKVAPNSGNNSTGNNKKPLEAAVAKASEGAASQA